MHTETALATAWFQWSTAWNSNSRPWPTITLITDTAMYLAPFSFTEETAPETNEPSAIPATLVRPRCTPTVTPTPGRPPRPWTGTTPTAEPVNPAGSVRPGGLTRSAWGEAGQGEAGQGEAGQGEAGQGEAGQAAGNRLARAMRPSHSALGLGTRRWVARCTSTSPNRGS